MNISFTKRILVIGSIFCGLLAPVKAQDKYHLYNEAINKFWTANRYAQALCLIENGSPKEKIEKNTILSVVKDGFYSGNFKDKKVEIIAKKMARELNGECGNFYSRSFVEESIEFLSTSISKPNLFSESNLFNDLVINYYHKDAALLLCNAYKKKKRFDISEMESRSYSLMSFFFNSDRSKYPKDIDTSSREYKQKYNNELLQLMEKHEFIFLKGEELNQFLKTLKFTCSKDALNAWNYLNNQSKKIKEIRNSFILNNTKIIRNTKDEKHINCLKAADYKGCMNYQNR